jgi:hypothetical protein
MNPNGLSAALKRAFLWHWHLLGLGTAASFALLSGEPGMMLPLVAAGELAYLGFLGLQPRFQNVLRGTAMLKQKGPADDAERFQKLAAFLSQDDLNRFQHLHSRCSALLDLRRSMDSKESADGVENFRGESLDRMLWLFLKLLHQKSGMERFIASTHRTQIESDLALAEEQLTTSKQRDTNTGVEGRLTSSINERIITIRERLQNFDKAGESLELVGAEIDKTEQQIIHLCEVGMTARDSAGLSAQVDSISASLQTSEKTFAHESIDSLFDTDAAPPLFSGSINVALPSNARSRTAIHQ